MYNHDSRQNSFSAVFSNVLQNVVGSILFVAIAALAVGYGFTSSEKFEDLKNWPIWVIATGLILVVIFGANAIRLIFRWWRLRSIRSASGRKISILVARIDGDEPSNAVRQVICDAVRSELKQAVEIITWPRALRLGDGHDEDVEAHVISTGKKWLKQKKCDLLVWGWIRSGSELCLRIIAADKFDFGARSFSLSEESIDLPLELVSHLGVAIALRVISTEPFEANLDHETVSVVIEESGSRLKQILDNSASFAPEVRATLHCTYGRISKLSAKITGSPEKLREALHHFDIGIRDSTHSPLLKAELLSERGLALKEMGVHQFDKATLSEALKNFEQAEKLLEGSGANFGLALLYDNMGTTLRHLGAQQTGRVTLERSIKMFQRALEIWKPGRDATNWAITKNNLANSWRELAERSGNLTEYLQAIQEYEGALSQIQSDSHPVFWATLQNNLGLTYQGAAHHSSEDEYSVTEYLRKAIAAFKLSLTRCSREATPMLWARIQGNLSIVLTQLSEQEGETVYVEDAIKRLNLVLAEMPKERSLSIWFQAQTNLGNAYRTLGEFSGNRELLDRALVAYRLVLDSTPKEALMNRATAKDNIGGLLVSIVEAGGSPKLLDEAISLSRSALQTFEDAHAEGLIKVAKYNVQRAKETRKKRLN